MKPLTLENEKCGEVKYLSVFPVQIDASIGIALSDTDLAAILGRGTDGAPLENPPLLESMAFDRAHSASFDSRTR